MISSKTVAVAAVAALLTLTTACGGGSTNEASGDSDSVTIALPTEPSSLDPHILEQDEVFQMDLAIYDRLMVRDDKGALVPGVAAEAPEQVNESTWRFKLRPDIKFTNGEPLDAEAVAYSFNRVLDPALQSRWIPTLTGIKGAKVVDSGTVDIMTDGPNPVLPAQTFYVGIMPPKATGMKDVGSEVIGSGPYELDTWNRGNQITVKANPDYWGEKPAIAEAKYVFPGDSATRVAGVLSGEYDIISELAPEDEKRMPASVSAPGSVIRLTRYSAMTGATADLRVREAMNLAIDTDGIIKSIFDGRAQPVKCQLLLPAWFGFNKNLKPVPYDQAKARALIKQAGATGEKVVLQATAGRYLRDRELNEAIVQSWKEIGLDASVEFLSSKKFLDTVFDETRTPAGGISTEHNNGVFDADRSVSNFYAPKAELSANKVKGLDEAIDAARREMDVDKRQAMYEDITKTACDEQLFYFGISPDDIYGLSKRINFEPRADAFIVPTSMSLKK